MKRIQTIVILGTGKLGYQLGLTLHKGGFDVVQVYNRTTGNGLKLAKRTGAEYIDDLRRITPSADLYILAVADSAISELASGLSLSDQLIVHVSGTVSLELLSGTSANYGVFYPVQTFTRNRRILFRQVPVCIEGNTSFAEEQLLAFARQVTKHVLILSSEKRQVLHLGAVLVSNFTNSLYAMAEEVLKDQGIPLDLLEPLIMQTARNVRHGELLRYQTGPAIRGDARILEKHFQLLKDYPDYLEIYRSMSENIIKRKTHDGKL